MASPSELSSSMYVKLFCLPIYMGKAAISLGKSNGSGGKHKKIFAVILGEAIFPLFLVFSADLDTPCSLFIVLPTRQILYII